jgi:DNA polymerase I-like protein with 3'-5' exonuclease and polymerase domains
MIALDTETTGVDLKHGAKPFFLSVSRPKTLETVFYEWDVDPLTREPNIPEDDVHSIQKIIFESDDRLVLHNAKFDVTALETILPIFEWPWDRTEDTLIGGHLLHSASAHDLTAMTVRYLGEDIQPYEDRLEEACKKARAMCRQKTFIEQHGQWKIAKEGLADMPSIKPSSKDKKDRAWKADAWLPKTVAKAVWESRKKVREDPNYAREWRPPYTDGPTDKGHPWWTVLQEYANADTGATALLWPAVEREINRRKLMKIYREQIRLARVIQGMETKGVSLSMTRINELMDEYGRISKTLGDECTKIAQQFKYDLQLPAGAVNNNLRTFCFDVLKLEPVIDPKAKTDNPCLNKDAFNHYLATLPIDSVQRKFVTTLMAKRDKDTAVTYMSSYVRYAVPDPLHKEVYIIYPRLNQTGTATLRMSSSNPNEQNISEKKIKGEEEEGVEARSVKYVFGPGPGREWWAMDYQNIELRIPAYESGEKDLIDLFERANEPPFYGSEHILNFSIVYPDLWAEVLAKVGPEKAAGYIKETYKKTWYGWCKNGDFAVGYGAGDATADKAFHKVGARRLLISRFSKKEAFNQHYIAMANKLGYVETLPDKSIDPDRGYPVVCSRGESNRISPTIPPNYHTQSTAMQCTRRAMVRCDDQFRDWYRDEGFQGWIPLQVHDEMVFDLPALGKRNIPKVRKLKYLMEQSGRDIGIPLTVSVSYHPKNWGEKVALAV